MQNVFSSLETYKKFMLMKYEAEKSLTFFKISNKFSDAKNWTGWTWPEDYRSVRGETVAAIDQRWLILAYNRNTQSPVFKHFTQ